ncbi:MAG: hypothetical protein Q9182_006901 [Xanthomendoza sp. 2 TL-2023]
MDATDLTNLLEILDDDIDELEDSLAPLIKHELVESASRLPLLDKAQLYILVTYAVESILFSYLRLNGVDVKEHAIFRELARVRQYFEKVEHVETLGSKRENLSLDKAAAGRIIKHTLSGNKQHNSKANEQQQREGHLRGHPSTNDGTTLGKPAFKGSKHLEKRAGFEQGKGANKRRKVEDGSLEAQNFENEDTASTLPALSPNNSFPVTTTHSVQTLGALGKEGNRRKGKEYQTHHASNEQEDFI